MRFCWLHLELSRDEICWLHFELSRDVILLVALGAQPGCDFAGCTCSSAGMRFCWLHFEMRFC